MALIVAVGALIYYFEDITAWVGNLWGKFTGFVGSLKIVENAVKGVKLYFNTLLAPIKYVIDLIDTFMSKFSIYSNAKAKIQGAWSSTKSIFGFEDEAKEANINNLSKNVISGEIVLKAEAGTQVVSSKQKGTNIKLPTVNNGVQ